jgi:hypothetical protein
MAYLEDLLLAPVQPVSHNNETTRTPDGVTVDVKLVKKWVATVQRHMYVGEEPHQCFPLSAISTIDCASENVDKERRAVALMVAS